MARTIGIGDRRVGRVGGRSGRRQSTRLDYPRGDIAERFFGRIHDTLLAIGATESHL